MIEFADDWLMHTTILGEGAFGEVRLLVNKHTDEKVACKIINYQRHANAETSIKKEIMINKMVHHENIIKYYGRRKESFKEYIFLEYASRGELFQLIEPDMGMPSCLAQAYMKQLLAGVKYLHSKGIAHRDIKPENLLITDSGVLKISDFGMATMFRLRGKERLLDRKCGTKPYLAPEVMQPVPYKAEPAEIWSCGIVLLAMITGELPWADVTSEEFQQYESDSYITYTPWSKLGNSTLSLIRKILMVDPSKRCSVDQILNHSWMKLNFAPANLDVLDHSSAVSSRRWNSMMEAETRNHGVTDTPNVILSQPLPTERTSTIDQLVNSVKARQPFCFSQPVHNEDLIINTPVQFSQCSITKDTFHKLIKRLTRFYVNVSYQEALETLCSVLDAHHFSWNVDMSGAVTVNTVDGMKNQLTFKANIIEMEGKILIDFRLNKGCGIEFKKKFIKIKQSLANIVELD